MKFIDPFYILSKSKTVPVLKCCDWCSTHVLCSLRSLSVPTARGAIALCVFKFVIFITNKTKNASSP